MHEWRDGVRGIYIGMRSGVIGFRLGCNSGENLQKKNLLQSCSK